METENKDDNTNAPSVVANNQKEQMFVKINLEGYAIGRKIDVKAHEGYESLYLAIQKMLNNFFIMNFGDDESTDEDEEELASEHIVIYEDNEGDRILLGDIPWEMFTNTVKRLFIINVATVSPRGERKTSAIIL